MSEPVKAVWKGGPSWDRLVAIVVEGDRLRLRGRTRGGDFEVTRVDFEHAQVTWRTSKRVQPRRPNNIDDCYDQHTDQYSPGSVVPVWMGES